jgi:putative ABC transport system permease protein
LHGINLVIGWCIFNSNHRAMLKNYFKIALRQLQKQKMYAVIKVGGFALGIAACLLIALYIRYQCSYDKDYPNDSRIYRVLGVINNKGKIERGTSWPEPFGKAMKNDFPEIEKSGRLLRNPLFYGVGTNEFRPADKMQNTYETGFLYADQEMLDIWQYPTVYGNLHNALSEPHTMVISKRKADKYFPGQNPVGKVVYLNDVKTVPYKITAVIENIPGNEHLCDYDFFITMAGSDFLPSEQNNWGDYNFDDYILLRQGTNVKRFEKKLSDGMINKYLLAEMRKEGVADAVGILKNAKLQLQPVADINLKSYDFEDVTSHGDIRFVWLFGAIAIFILIIACINFINLSTAKSANRAKEVGLRKVVGSGRGLLINQFLVESIFYSIVAFIIGVALAWLALPYFNQLADKHLTMLFGEWWFIPSMLGAAVLIGVAAGLYPAFYLSSFKPVQVLKGTISSGAKSSFLRNGLVIFQFTTSIILVIGTIVIYSQMKYVLNRKLGFDKDQLVMIQGTNTLQDQQVRDFKTELQKLASVKSVSISDYLPVNGTKRNGNTFYKEGRNKIDEGVGGQMWQVDNDYIKTMGLKLIAGRNFTPGMSTDSNALIINETMAKKLNLKDPVGKRISNGYNYPVIGVVKDFNFENMKQEIGPLALHWGWSPSIVTVKVNTANMQNTLASITSVWKQFTSDQPIRYTFMDEEFANMYAEVQRTSTIFTCFAVLAIIIGCLGLFALSAFMAEQRSKEIGIRKVLGATVTSITRLLSFDFVKLVLIAIVIASPIAWWAMNKWLEDFAYRINVQWWMFVVAGSFAVLIALFTVSFQSIKAALVNPIKSLKSE